MPISKTALIIFAKRPALGNGKQRLAHETSKEIAFEIAKNLLQTTLSTVKNFDGDIVISPSTAKDSEWSHALLERPCISIPQREGKLGTRLMQVDREVRMLGYTNNIFIGTDAPTLSLKHIKQVKDHLQHYQQAFIPATDGGVVLMASCVPWSKLEQIEWSTEKVFMQLKSITVQQGLSCLLYTSPSPRD